MRTMAVCSAARLTVGGTQVIEEARIRPGHGFRPIHSILYYAQRVAAPVFRDVGATCLAAGRRLFHPAPSDSDGTGRAIATAIKASGYSLLGPVLTGKQVAEARAWLATRKVFNVARPGAPFAIEEKPQDVNIAGYGVEDIVSCPHLLELMNRPAILSAVGAYLGCAPTIAAITLSWSFLGKSLGENGQRFHRDPDDWRFVKLLTYLTDVDAGSGCHMFITGTHRQAGTLRAPCLSDEEAANRYSDRIRELTGPGGFGFLVDTYGWHKGAVPSARPRLLLTVQYSILPVYRFVPKPVSRSGIGTAIPAVDPWINRLIVC